MHAVSQIIERNLHRQDFRGSTLWINPEKDDCWQNAKSNCTSLKLFSQDFGVHTFLKQAGADVEFAAFPQENGEKYQWIIVNLPRQKALLRMMLDCAAGLLADGGVLWLAGENKAGIKSADKLLKLYFSQVRKLDNARHCALYQAGVVLNQRSFKPLEYRQKWVLDCQGTGIHVTSYPGVFAHGRVDAGTALLLDTLAEMTLQGDVLDFACGAGIIGACIATRSASTSVTLLDINALALRSCKETLAGNHLNGSVLASDGLSELESSFDVVVSNPPIHAGVKTDDRLSIRLLESVHDHIRPGGMLVLVANVHLPYEKWLSQSFRRSVELTANDGYKVILAKT
ncbi:MAG: class I SAM-dependent methyltransferase [Gammaproteobacteria bacterium]|nr:class I SAM-dependent methyltransferase [Gammaproteobacteria bacterium]